MPAVLRAAAIAAAAAALLAGCGRGTTHAPVPGADIEHGQMLIEYYGCGACHVIGGINPQGHVGPRLVGFENNRQIAGTLPNTVDNLVKWIEDPQKILPKSDMPDLGIGEPGAKDIAAYLYTH